MFYSVHDPHPTKGERDFISSYVRGVWTGEQAEYNRAAFLSKMFEEYPSTKGKVNMAVMICLMTIYGWEMYPRLVRFEAREDIPPSSPEVINLHRAIVIAATEGGAWSAGDKTLAAEERKWHRCCKTYEPHYCLVSSMEFPEKKPWEE
ncbi:uncharacterized protein DFL_005838 [Arthrobotrys flagrans]|uniref:Uncharacterized protein n=1 Tax=Arthrobotrys flagrans TaxID=97331 RepID=A0A436ZYZ6_ARTFL|nr:hypothetical protein DFL_005838 [Arthrobotrys flagrans]